MTRAIAVAGLLTASVWALSVSSADGCGDKSLSAGGIRWQRALAARYPASVLFYAPPTSRLSGAARELKLQETLRSVGHKYRDVSTWSDLVAAIDTGQFNVIVADFSDLSELQQRFGSVASRVAIVPVAYKLSKAETKSAKRQCRLLIKAPGGQADHLAAIHQAVRSTSGALRKG